MRKDDQGAQLSPYTVKTSNRFGTLVDESIDDVDSIEEDQLTDDSEILNKRLAKLKDRKVRRKECSAVAEKVGVSVDEDQLSDDSKVLRYRLKKLKVRRRRKESSSTIESTSDYTSSEAIENNSNETENMLSLSC